MDGEKNGGFEFKIDGKNEGENLNSDQTVNNPFHLTVETPVVTGFKFGVTEEEFLGTGSFKFNEQNSTPKVIFFFTLHLFRL